MLPDPLHPAVAHFPIVLAILAPIVALGSLLAIRKGARPLRAWGLTVGVLALLVVSAWFAVETGEVQEERVEAFVPEGVLDEHEEAGEIFLYVACAVLIIGAVGLLHSPVISRAARLIGTIGAFVLIVLVWRAGESGGDLVYEFDAARAYMQGAGKVDSIGVSVDSGVLPIVPRDSR